MGIIMKVLQINMTYPHGSTGKIVQDIATQLRVEENECYIAYVIGEQDSKYEYAVKTRMSIYGGIIRSRAWGRNGFTDKKSALKLVAWIRDIKPDIIHLHNLHGMYIDIRVLFDYLQYSKIPVVWTLHDCWSITGHCASFDYVGCTKWKTGCFDCQQLGYYPFSYIDRTRKNYSDKKNVFTSLPFEQIRLVVPSKWLEKKISESYLKNYTVDVIYNGIDLEVFKPTKSEFRIKYNLMGKKLILGVVYGYNERKGVLYFNELAERLSEEYKIILVGISSKEINKFNDKIMLLPKTSSKRELAELYTVADVFVNLTLEEVLGLTNIEALACGTPVITFSSGGSPECIDNETGIVVKRGDIKAVEKAIKHITGKTKNVYEENCIERARNYFDNKKMIYQYIQLYESLYGGKG